jgi:hypothetical protein
VREPPIVLISPTPKDKALHLHIAITTCVVWGFSPPLLLSKSSLLPTETVHWSLLYITTCLYIVSLVPTVIYRQRSQLGRTRSWLQMTNMLHKQWEVGRLLLQLFDLH